MNTSISESLVKSLNQEEEKIKDKFSRADLYLTKEKDFISSQDSQEKSSYDFLVREGISLPQSEANRVEEMKGKITKPGFYPTKSELFRAGLLCLSQLSEEKIVSTLQKLPKLKPGRKRPLC